MNEYTIYFADVTVTITEQPLPAPYETIACDGEASVPRAKIVKKAESHKYIAVVTPDPERTMRALAAQFVQVEAAGGVVRNAAGELLLILRNGRWDLPKGHREAGESLETCAAREAEEETGVKVARVAGLLCTTVHCYDLYGRWEMKRTSWFAMEAAPDAGAPHPQTEEGIVAAEWAAPDEAARRIKASFPTIREVFRALYDKGGSRRSPAAKQKTKLW